MKVLVIGAGAVGQVYGRHLQLGGAEVSFLVRPKHEGEHDDGFTMYPLRAKGEYAPVVFRPDGILTSLDEVKGQKWDQVWVCVASTALVRPWVDEICAATGDATLVFFAAGMGVVERLELPEERCVFGLISMMSYFAPLDGETVAKPGVAYWFPPLSPTSFAGPAARRDAAVAALERGECPAVSREHVRESSAFGSALLIPHITALEGAGWSYERFVREHWLADSIASTREALAAAASHLGARPPFAMRLVGAWSLRLLLAVLRAIAPLDLAKFFKIHFTKVREQSQMQMAEYIRLGTQGGQPVTALSKLTEAVFGEGWKQTHLPAQVNSGP